MNLDMSSIGGTYQIFVAEDNSSFYVRWILSNDAVGTDAGRVLPMNVESIFRIISARNA